MNLFTRIAFPGGLIGLVLVMGSCKSAVEGVVNVSQSARESLGARLVADSQGGLHLVWYDLTPGHYNIFYAAKPWGGEWSQPVRLSRTESYSREPCLAIDSQDTLHLVWHGPPAPREKEDIFYATKPSGGDWSEPVNLTQTDRHSQRACIIADREDNLHLVYSEWTGISMDIHYTFKPKGGDWSEPINLTFDDDESQDAALVADGAGNLHLAWSSKGETPWEILYMSRPPPHGQWSKPINISNNEGKSRSPRLAVDSRNNVHLLWHDDSLWQGVWDIMYTFKPPGGDWAPVVNLHQDIIGSAGYPWLVIDDEDTLHLAWNYLPPGPDQTYDILYATKPQGGDWSRAINISHNKPESGDPVIALGRGDKVYIAWSDQSPGDWDILVASLRG
ncbi:MAG TPA: hypothetical protein G4O03_08420 [Dehalococcoidia bacterium]|nr:hypothetical protein [Dehalococcoidia bacterium]